MRDWRAWQRCPGVLKCWTPDTPYKVILDYSHSPDAPGEYPENRARSSPAGRRDRAVRLRRQTGTTASAPLWARSPAGWRICCILTSDNPRTEDPIAILAAIEEGIKPTGCKPISSSRTAGRLFAHALEMGRDGDVIVLAGKGHETYQEIMGVKRPFDEKVVVQELLQELRRAEAQ